MGAGEESKRLSCDQDDKRSGIGELWYWLEHGASWVRVITPALLSRPPAQTYKCSLRPCEQFHKAGSLD